MYILQPTELFPGKWYPILDPNSVISIPYPRISCFIAAHTYIIPIMAAPLPPWESKLLQVTPQNAMIDWTPMGQVTQGFHFCSHVWLGYEWVIKTKWKQMENLNSSATIHVLVLFFFSPTSAFEIPVVCQIWPPFLLALWTIQSSNCWNLSSFQHAFLISPS